MNQYDCYVGIIKSILKNQKNFKYKLIISSLINTIFSE